MDIAGFIILVLLMLSFIGSLEGLDNRDRYKK